MKRFWPLLTISLCFECLPSFAQSKSISGYYITPTGDTVQGHFPNYAQWNKNPLQIKFIARGASSSIQLTPLNTHKFLIEGQDEYVSYAGTRLINPIENAMLFDETTTGNVDSFNQVNIFLRLVIKTEGGDLYIFKDASRTNFFIQLPGQPAIELRYKKIRIQSQIVEVADYKQQLNSLFSEHIASKRLASTLDKLSYEEKALASFFRRMFPAATVARKEESGNVRWTISAGAVLNKVSVKNKNGFNSIPQSYSSSYSPQISVGAIIPLHRRLGRYFLYPQVKLFRYKNSGEQNQSTFISKVTYQADLAFITQMSGGINVINKESQQLFLTVGLGALGQLRGKQIKQRYSEPGHLFLDEEEKKASTMSYMMDVSIGVNLNRILLSATYMMPTSISNFVYYTPKLSGIQLSVGYKF